MVYPISYILHPHPLTVSLRNLARITVPGPFFIGEARRGTMVDTQDFLYPHEESGGLGVRVNTHFLPALW